MIITDNEQRPITSKTASVIKWIETNKVYLFVSVAFICLVLYLRKIVLSKICISYCLVSLNSVFFFNLVCFDVIIYAFGISEGDCIAQF